ARTAFLAAVAVLAVAVAGALSGVGDFLRAPVSRPAPVAVPRGSSTTVSGVLDQQFLSASTWWLEGFTPAGRTVVLGTIDGGRTWRRRLDVPGLRPGSALRFFDDREGVLIAQPVRSATALSGTSSRAPLLTYSTRDGGATWTSTRGTPIAGDLEMAGFSDLRHGWALAGRGAGGGPAAVLYLTRDGGRRWTRTGPVPGGARVLGLRFTSPGVGWLKLSRPNGRPLLRTEDGGRTWSTFSLPLPGGGAADWSVPRLPPVDGAAGGLVAVVARHGSGAADICYSGDGGRTWGGPSPGAVIAHPAGRSGQVYVIGLGSWAVSDGTSVSITDDGGGGWTTNPAPRVPGMVLRALDFVTSPTGSPVGFAMFGDTGPGAPAGFLAGSPAGRLAAAVAGSASAGIPGQRPPLRERLLETTDEGSSWRAVVLPSP
ncbi:MAG: WD40/YVTN/BNR-like repeat-containing protein, partial [Candidatus Dormibacteraceae bacterium]